MVWAAGTFEWGPAPEADPQTCRALLDLNLTAAAAATALLLPRLVADAPSALVYVGSGAARQAFPDNAAYVASKHGLRGLAEGVWSDVRAQDVKVGTVSPGLVAAAVRFVVTFPGRGCPTEIRVEQHHPI